jgi:hypothetical protein
VPTDLWRIFTATENIKTGTCVRPTLYHHLSHIPVPTSLRGRRKGLLDVQSCSFFYVGAMVASLPALLHDLLLVASAVAEEGGQGDRKSTRLNSRHQI